MARFQLPRKVFDMLGMQTAVVLNNLYVLYNNAMANPEDNKEERVMMALLTRSHSIQYWSQHSSRRQS